MRMISIETIRDNLLCRAFRPVGTAGNEDLIDVHNSNYLYINISEVYSYASFRACIPIYYASYYIKKLIYMSFEENSTKIVINRDPLEIIATPIAKMGVSRLHAATFPHSNIKKPIDYLFRNLTNNLRRVDIKGEIYYGLPGLIFDKDLRPLMYCYLDTVITISKEILFKDIICAIDPTVLNKDTIMSKFIMKEFIPEFLKTSKPAIRRLITGDFVEDDSLDNINIKVEIGDLSKFFHKPQEPKTENIDFTITNFLKTVPV